MQAGTSGALLSPDELVITMLLDGLHRSPAEELPEDFQRADQVRLPGSIGTDEHHEPAQVDAQVLQGFEVRDLEVTDHALSLGGRRSKEESLPH